MWPALTLAALTIAVHAPSLGNGFVWDDEQIVVSNPQTRDISELGKVLLSPDESPPYYRPLSRASYLVDYQLFGMDPRGFHAVSLAVHLATVLALYALGLRLFGARAPAFVAALLLAVHPLDTEAVAFVTARNNLLATLFALIAVTLLIDAARTASIRRTIASGVAFFLGLLSKEPALMALPLMAAWLALPFLWRDARSRRSLAWLAPHGLALVAYLVMRTVSLGGVIGAAPAGSTPASSGGGLLSRLSVNLYSIPKYIELALFPSDLTIFHLVPAWPPVALGAAWLGIALVVAYFIARPSVASTAGLLWFALNLAPIANLVRIPTTSLIAERYLYAPAVGLWLVAAEIARRVAGRLGWRAPAAVLTVVGLGLATRTIARTRDWHDDRSLATSAVRAEPRAAEAHFNLGVVLKDSGDLGGARREWNEVLRLEPDHARALTQLGTADAVAGDLASAEEKLRRAIAVDSTIAIAHYNLARISELTGRPDDAIAEYAAFLEYTSSRSERRLVDRSRERLAVLRSAAR